MTTEKQTIDAIREKYDETKRRQSQESARLVNGEVADYSKWAVRNAHLSGEREAYAYVLGMLGASLT